MTRVRIDDLRRAGVGTCAVAREWCRRHGFSYDELRRDGIDAERADGIDDHASDLARVIRQAELREAEEARVNGR